MTLTAAEKKFIQDWLIASNKSEAELGEYWVSTPSRLYWALTFEAVTDWEAVRMAGDLTILYENTGINNAAIKRAKTLIVSTR